MKGPYFPRSGEFSNTRFPERRIVVDSGAVPYVVNGADVMRPGIVSVSDDIRAGAPAQVVEERHGKPIAICIALHDAPGIREMKSGKACRNIHHVGDEIWATRILATKKLYTRGFFLENFEKRQLNPGSLLNRYY